jgi:hypothetical protein
MTKRKNMLIVILFLALVITSSVLSYFYGFRQGIRTGGVTATMAEYWFFHDHMTDQMANADCEGVRKALWVRMTLVDTKVKVQY